MNKVLLTITYEPGMPVQVTGPIQDRMLCYAMLEMAKDAIRDFKMGQGEVSPIIVPPRAAFLPRSRNGGE